MKKYIDSNTRIKTGFLLRAYGHAIYLQRRVGYFWVTTSWTYPQIFQNLGYEYTVNWLIKHENSTDPTRESEQKRIGRILMKEKS